MVEEELLSTVEAAQIVGCARDVIWRAIRDGVLPAKRVGRSYVVRRSDLQAWISAGHYKPEMARRYPSKQKGEDKGT